MQMLRKFAGFPFSNLVQCRCWDVAFWQMAFLIRVLGMCFVKPVSWSRNSIIDNLRSALSCSPSCFCILWSELSALPCTSLCEIVSSSPAGSGKGNWNFISNTHWWLVERWCTRTLGDQTFKANLLCYRPLSRLCRNLLEVHFCGSWSYDSCRIK